MIIIGIFAALVIIGLAGLCLSYRDELRQPRSIQILLPSESEEATSVIGVLVDGQPMPDGWEFDVSYEFGEPETPSVAENLRKFMTDDTNFPEDSRLTS